MTGPKLRELRMAAGVRPADVARRMGVPRQRILVIERQKRVPVPTAEAYLNAVEAVKAHRLGAKPMRVRVIEATTIVTDNVAQNDGRIDA